AVNLNCGCPQRWAIAEGIGCALLRKPALVADMVHTAWRQCGSLPISVKIRLLEDDRATVELIRRAERMGASWIDIHARLPRERAEPARVETAALCCDAVGVPVVYNGDVRSLEDAHGIAERTGAAGVMAARGLLANPGMFTGA